MNDPNAQRASRNPIWNANRLKLGVFCANTMPALTTVPADIGLVALFGEEPAAWARQVRQYKQLAQEEFGKSLQVCTTARIVLRDTRGEAETYLQHCSVDAADGIEPEAGDDPGPRSRQPTISPRPLNT